MNMKEETYHYIKYDIQNTIGIGDCFSFNEDVILVGGLAHNLPDLFLTMQGINALIEEVS